MRRMASAAALDPPMSTGELAGAPLLDEEYMVLSPIHSAKGCEWDVVYLIHAADGVLPSDMADGEAALEEERRLLYVATTRARDRLYTSYPLRYYHRKHALGDSRRRSTSACVSIVLSRVPRARFADEAAGHAMFS
jgi:DNA helicase-2/ATP-dependent DNA helicase PcrA